jgi:pimeloyl-ACP methyl ester carboxylesterase
VRLTVSGLRDEVRRLRGREPYRIPIVGPPGTVAVMNSPDADPGYRALFSPGDEFRNEVAARVGLRVGTYRPIRYAGRIACPWLVAVCDRDVVTPPEPALKAATRAPRSEVRRYDAEHFDIYVGELFERVVADQVAFLERHLPVRAAAQHQAATG